jgi:hypothetical protein
MVRLLVVARPVALVIVPTVMASSCSRTANAVNTVYVRGIAKDFQAVEAANYLTGRLFVSTKLHHRGLCAAARARGNSERLNLSRRRCGITIRE